MAYMEYIESDTVIGRVMREHRKSEQLKWSQSDLANRLHRHTGNPWDQSKVSDAENGHYAFTVTDLIAIGYIFGVPPFRFLSPDLDDSPNLSVKFGNVPIRQGEIFDLLIRGNRGAPFSKADTRFTTGIDPYPLTLREHILNVDDSDTETSPQAPRVDVDDVLAALNRVPAALAALNKVPAALAALNKVPAALAALEQSIAEEKERNADGIDLEDE